MQGIQVDEGDDSDFEKNSNVRLKASAGRKHDRTASSEKNDTAKQSENKNRDSARSPNRSGRPKKDPGPLAKYGEEAK